MSPLGQCSLRSVAFPMIWMLSLPSGLSKGQLGGTAAMDLLTNSIIVRQAVGYYTSKCFTTRDLAIQQRIKICI
ncbi:hypothetical protein BO83DRAFT_383627 [Aspergillus eucalypticola CBS 122712]|uniref:Uncharacterized protein n=1 Tax=Aspergillus eucalypticola (strain CBS 122712 / IBT 29274) TaxID=1448314 RepID=A0A317UJ28_ASPEC|nr:uncharacterized protein BO83DRAFT_383627 [Aspergillus eucalypticola CBS 122712]PWY62093.1 hypothetical protein BO83DRAFT_383627 [Aspergillus eucalypticola CBS 122712]